MGIKRVKEKISKKTKGAVIAMFSIKKMIARIEQYYEDYTREHVMRKSVSLLVVICFIVNIANLPAYASEDKSIYEKKRQQQQMKEDGGSTGVSYTDTQSYFNPNQALEANRMKGMSEGVEGALVENGEAVGSIVDGEITTKKLGDAASKKDETRTELLEKKIGKAAEEAGLGKYNDSEQTGGKSINIKVTGASEYRQIVEKVSKETGFKAKTVEAVLKKLGTRGVSEAVQVEREGKGIAERVKSLFGKVIGDKGSAEEASVTETKTIGNKEETKPEGYEEVVKELSKQSGVSEEEISKQLEGLDKSVLEQAIGLLSQLFAQGGQIVNCATEVLASVLNGVSKGVLALQALLVDIATGAFVANNKESIESGSNQLMTSMDAMSKVLQSYGKEAVGYAVDLEGFLSGLKEGESGIVWVNEDHYVTVTKLADGKYGLKDSNVNEGKAIILSAEAVKSVLSGNNVEAKDESGNTISVFGYKAVGEDGKVKVLTDSEGVSKAEGAEAISSEKMKEIAGAKTVYKEVTTTKTVEKTKMVEMTGYRQETRSREVSGTRTVKNADGTTSEHSYSYTVTYTVTVEYKYKVEVKYTEEIEITERIAVEVPDEDDAAKKKAAEEAAKKAWEDNIAKMKQKEFEDKLKEAAVISAKVVSSTEEAEKQKIKEAKEKAVQEMSNDEFKKKVDKGELEITKVTVTDVQGEGLTQAAKNAFMNSVNAALNATGATFDGNYASQALNAMTNTAVKIMNGTMAAGQVLKDLAFNVLGLSTGKAGVVVDQNAGTMTQYGTDGTKTIVTVADGTDYKKLQQTIDDKGFTAANDWLKTNGNFKSETKYDAAGSEIYTAKNIGYEPNNHAMAIEYDFKQAYNDQVYFTNVNAGDKKVVIENFHTDASRENAMVYSVGDGAGTKQKTSTGLEFTADVQSLDRVTKWDSKTVNGEKVTVAKSVDFIGGKDGKASAFEEAVLGNDGSVSVTRYDLNDAYYDEKQDPKSGGSGGSSTTLVDEYKNVLSGAENIKITDKKDLYSGFEYVDNSWIDMGKIQTYSYDSSSPNNITKQGKDSNGNDVVVTAEFEGEDWRYNRTIVGNSAENQVVISSQNADGTKSVTTYSANVVIDQNFNYTNLSNSNMIQYNYDKKGNLIGGKAVYNAGTEMSTVFGGGLEGDTIILDTKISFTFTVDKNNQMQLFDLNGNKISGLAISGTYVNKVNGVVQAKGKLQNAKIEVNEQGLLAVSGKVIINQGDTFDILKGKSDGSDEKSDASVPDASDTNARVVENESGYKISDGSISLRGGSLVVMGDGAIFKAGSNLTGIGAISDGSLKIKYEEDENGDLKITYTAAGKNEGGTGECRVESTSSDGKLTTAIRYDTEGIVRTFVKNNDTGATLTTTYKTYNARTQKWDPVVDANGNQSALITLTATKPGDTGLGYNVDKMSGSSITLNVDANGQVKLNSGAVVSRLILSNDSGDKIFLTYKGLSDGTGYSGYELREASGAKVQIAMAEDGKYYGFKGNKIIEITLALGTNGSPESFSIGEATGFSYDESTKTYTKLYATENDRKNIVLGINEQGNIFATSKLIQFNLNGTWYDVVDAVQLPGGGTLVLAMTDKYPIYCTVNDDGSYRQIKSGDKIGDFTVGYNAGWTLTTGKSFSIMGENGLTGSLTGTFRLTNNAQGFIIKTFNDSKISYTNQDGTIVSNITLNAGSQVVFGADGVYVIDGIISLTDKQKIKIPPAESSSDGSKGSSDSKQTLPDATGTNAKVIEQENGGYVVSDGKIRISGGSLVVYGKGAIFKQGSEIGGQKVTSGAIKIADFRTVIINGIEQTLPVFVAASGTATTNMGGLTVKYNTSGITGKVQTVSRSGGGVTTNSDGSQYQTVTKTTVTYNTQIYTAEDGKKYTVFKYKADGTIDTVQSKSYYKNWIKTPEQAKLEKLVKQLSSLESVYSMFNSIKNIPVLGKIFSFVMNPVEQFLNAKIKEIKTQIYNSVVATNPDIATSISKLGLTQEQVINNIQINSQGNVVIRGIVDNNVVNNVLSTQQQVVTTYTGAYDLVIDKEGAFYASAPESAYGLFTLQNLTVDGKTLAASDFSGYITNIELGVSEEGGFVATGNFDFVNTKAGAEYTEYTQPNPNPESDSSGETVTVNTSGLIDQSVTGQTTLTNGLNGENAVLSFRNGSAVILGEGTTALSGSKLQSAAGIVTTTGGDYTYNAGTWVAGKDAGWIYNSAVKESLETNGKFTIDSFGTHQFNNGDIIKSNISFDAMTMIQSMYESEGTDTKYEFTAKEGCTVSGLNITADGKFSMQKESVTAFEGAEQTTAFVLRAIGDVKAKGSLADGYTVSGYSADSFKNADFSFTDGQVLSIAQGIKNIVGSNVIITNNVPVTRQYAASAESITYKEGELKISVDQFGNFTLASQIYGGVYNGQDFYLGVGSKVVLTNNGLVVTDGIAVVNGMVVNKTESNGENTGDESTSNITYQGDVNDVYDQQGNLTGYTLNGAFLHYSDSLALDSVFSAGNVLKEGSIITGGVINGEKIQYGALQCVQYIDAEGNTQLGFVAYNGTVYNGKSYYGSAETVQNLQGADKAAQEQNGYTNNLYRTYDTNGVSSAVVKQTFAKGNTSSQYFSGGSYTGYEVTNADAYVNMYLKVKNVDGVNVIELDSNGSFIVDETKSEYNLEMQLKAEGSGYIIDSSISIVGTGNPADFTKQSFSPLRTTDGKTEITDYVTQVAEDGTLIIAFSQAGMTDLLNIRGNSIVSVNSINTAADANGNSINFQRYIYTSGDKTGQTSSIRMTGIGDNASPFSIDLKDNTIYRVDSNGNSYVLEGQGYEGEMVDGNNQSGSGTNMTGNYAFVFEDTSFVVEGQASVFDLLFTTSGYKQNADTIAIFSSPNGGDIATVYDREDGHLSVSMYGFVPEQKTEMVGGFIGIGATETIVQGENWSWQKAAGVVEDEAGNQYLAFESSNDNRKLIDGLYRISGSPATGYKVEGLVTKNTTVDQTDSRYSTGQVNIVFAKDAYGNAITGLFTAGNGVDVNKFSGYIEKIDVNGQKIKLQAVWDSQNKQLKMAVVSLNEVTEIIDLRAYSEQKYGWYSDNNAGLIYDLMDDAESNGYEIKDYNMVPEIYINGQWVKYDENNAEHKKAYEDSSYSNLRYEKIEVTRTESISDFVWAGNFNGNGERKFTIDSIVFDTASMQFVSTVGLILTTDKFNTTGDTNVPIVPPDQDKKKSSEPEPQEINEPVYAVSAYIDGSNITLIKTENSDLPSKVALTVNTEQLLGNGRISEYSFSHFYAGTNLTFFKPSTLVSNDANTRDLSNSSVDAGEVVKQTVTASVTGGSVLLKTETTFANLTGAVINSGVNGGTINVTSTITVDNNGVPQIIQISASMGSGQTWEDANKNFKAGTSLDNMQNLANGTELLGGIYKNGKIEMGGLFNWNGTIDLNKNVTDISIEKGWLARGVEVVSGVVVSIVGAVLEGLPALAISIGGWLTGNGFSETWDSCFNGNNSSLLKTAASLIKNKQYGDVTSGEAASAAFAGVAAIAAIATTIITAGAGAAVWATVLSAAISATYAATAAFASSEAFQRDGIWSAEGWLNLAACALAIAFPMKIGSAATKAGEQVVTKTFSEVVKEGVTKVARLFTKEFWKESLTSISKGIANVFSKEAWSGFTYALGNGFKTSLNKIAALFGRQGITQGGTFASFFARGEGLVGTVSALKQLSQHMYAMWGLQMGMTATANILNPIVDKGALFGLYDWAIRPMGGDIIALDKSNSMAFAVIMYGAMPIFQGMFTGFGNVVAGRSAEAAAKFAAEKMAEQTTRTVISFGSESATSVGAKALNGFARLYNGYLRTGVNRLISGIFEEGIVENAIQMAVTPLVGSNMAQYVSEFLSADGDASFNTNNVMQQYGNSIKASSRNTGKALSTMQTMLTEVGLDSTFKLTQTKAGGVTSFNFTDNLGTVTTINTSSRSEVKSLMIAVGSVVQQMRNNPAMTYAYAMKMLNSNFAFAKNNKNLKANIRDIWYSVNSGQSIRSISDASRIDFMASISNYIDNGSINFDKIADSIIDANVNQTAAVRDIYDLVNNLVIISSADVGKKLARQISKEVPGLIAALASNGSIRNDNIARTIELAVSVTAGNFKNKQQMLSDLFGGLNITDSSNIKTDFVTATRIMNSLNFIQSQVSDKDLKTEINNLYESYKAQNDIVSGHVRQVQAVIDNIKNQSRFNNNEDLAKSITTQLVADKLISLNFAGAESFIEKLIYQGLQSKLPAEFISSSVLQAASLTDSFYDMASIMTTPEQDVLTADAVKYVKNWFGQHNKNMAKAKELVALAVKYETNQKLTPEETELMNKAFVIAQTLEWARNRMQEVKEYPDFKDGQFEAMYDISMRYLNAKDSKEQFKVIEELRTGGGKTIISQYTTALLTALNPGGFVTALTNTDDNAKELETEYKKFFEYRTGDKIEDRVNVVLVTSEIYEQHRSAGTLQQLRDKISKAQVLITTYSGWSGIVASDFAGLVANENNKQLSEKIRKLLSENNIELSENNDTGKIEFVNSSDASKTVSLLLKLSQIAGNEDIRQAINDMTIDISKITDVVADEVDYALTIPSQALSSSKGKYYNAASIADYYAELIQLQKNIETMSSKDRQTAVDAFTSKYVGLGIDNNRITQELKDVRRDSTKIVALYSEIAKQISNGQENAQDIFKALQSENLFDSVVMSQNRIMSDITQFIEHAATVKYFRQLAKITEGLNSSFGKILSDLDVSEDLVQLREGESGSLSRTEKNKTIMLAAAEDIHKGEAQQAEKVNEETQKNNSKVGGNTTPEARRDAILEQARELYKTYGKMFSLAQIVEHINNGMIAHNMTNGSEYDVVNGRVIINNMGRNVENLSQPAGTMQVLEVLSNIELLSKPNIDNFTSNSAFAMNLFKNFVGLTGTVSERTKFIFEGMGVKINNNPDKFESDNFLFQTQKATEQYVIELANRFGTAGQGTINMIFTADGSKVAKFIETLRESITSDLSKIGITQADDIDKVFAALTDTGVTGEALKKLAPEGTDEAKIVEEAAPVNAAALKAGIEKLITDLSVRYSLDDTQQEALRMIMTNTVIQANSAMSDAELNEIKYKAQQGSFKFIIGDAYLLGRGWDLGHMRSAKAKINQAQQISDTSTSITATVYLMDPVLMTDATMRQAGGRIDPFDSNRFDQSAYNKNIISLYSVENCRTIDKLADQVAKEDGKWSISTILSNLSSVQESNEESELSKAGQKIMALTTKNTVAKNLAGLNALGIDLTKLTEEQKAAITYYVPVDDKEKLTSAQIKHYESILNFAYLANLAGADSKQITSMITSNETLKTVISGNVRNIFAVLNSAAFEKTEVFKNLSDAVVNFDNKDIDKSVEKLQLANASAKVYKTTDAAFKGDMIIGVVYDKKEKRFGFENITVDKDKNAVQAQTSIAETISYCAEATVEALGKVIALEPLTKAAVKMNPFAQDALMVAGFNESLDKATPMGELRAKTGFEYRTVNAVEVDELGTPFVAYINSKEADKAGHVITVTKVNNGMVTYSDNTVKDVEISIGSLYDMGFEGLVLTSPKSTAGTKINSFRENTEKVIGKEAYDKLSAAGKKLANEIVNGVTKPQDMNTTLSALLAICKDGDAVAAMLGYAGMKDATDRREITAKYYEKVGQVLALKGVSEADKQVSIKLLAMARDVIFMASGNEKAAQMLNNSQIKAEDIISMLVVSKAVNQNVIVKTVVAGVMGVSEEEFVIDIAKLQQAVKSKTSISNAKKALEDLAAMLSANGRGSASMPMSLMKLSDVRAVAQAA